MRLLLTNDDGMDAPGIAALAEVASEFGEVVVVAPHLPCSGCGHRIVTDRPIGVKQERAGWYRVEGFPADCVRLALAQLVDQVDWVLSGINDGANLGADIHVSGTVAAVREAALFRVPGIALSQFRNRPSNMSWDQTSQLARQVLQAMLNWKLEAGDFLNVNLPDPPNSPEPKVCPVDDSPLPFHYAVSDQGYRYQGIYQERSRHVDSDVHHCFSGTITVSQLSVRDPRLVKNEPPTRS